MPKFSVRSQNNLSQCHPDIQKVMNEVIKFTDFSVLVGYRGKEDQDKAVADGHSNLAWPDSKHNKHPSLAVDIAPYPIDWDDINRFFYLAGVVLTIAQQNGINLKWGGYWTSLKDYPHFELIINNAPETT